MANSKNARNDKKEHFDFIQDVMSNPIKLAIVIAIIVLSGVAIYLFLTQQQTTGSNMFSSLSDTSPMAPLTNTPTN
jgi:hypothetical protein